MNLDPNIADPMLSAPVIAIVYSRKRVLVQGKEELRKAV